MAHRPGAIINTIYYILQECRRLDTLFDAGFIIGQYNDMLNDEHHRSNIMNITKKFKKHHRNNEFATFKTVSSLKGWLQKHSAGGKPIEWFEEENGEFLLINSTRLPRS
jgi:hypothetical protein